MKLYAGKSTGIKKRWANHKSHPKKLVKSCELSTHIIENHPSVDPSSIIKICLVDKAENEAELAILEDQWRWKLMTWAPHGLNVKND